MNHKLLYLLLVSLVATTGCFGKRSVPDAPNSDVFMAIRSEFGTSGTGDVAAAELPKPVGFTDITGTIKLNGAAPTRTPLTITKDQEVCGTGTLPDPTLQVGPNGGLANVLIYLDKNKLITKKTLSDPTLVHPMYDVTKNPALKSKVFDQKKCEFLTRVFGVRTNQQLIIKNSDPVGHNTALKAIGFDQTIPPGSQTEITPPSKPSPRPFPVSCAVHPWMSAYMITRDDPYFASTTETGAFKIEKLPAGSAEKPIELPFRFWHEGKNLRKNVIVSAKVNGTEIKWKNSGKIKLKLVAGQPLNIEITVSAASFQ